MSLTLIFPRLAPRKSAGPTTLRVDVCPPDVCPRRDTLWVAALRWLVGNDAEVAPVLRAPLDKARAEFVSALEGLHQQEAVDLLCRVEHARSLRELWHLRTELYGIIARRTTQFEAEARMARLNQHFPTRAQRSALQTPETCNAQ